MQFRSFAAVLAAAVVLTLQARPSAHDIAPSVTVHAFVKPEAERLRVLIRVPVHAMRDINFPTRGLGYLDVPRADDSLRHAAQLWVVNALEVYEDGQRLEDGRLVAVMASLPSDRSFASYDEALAHVTGPPLPADTAIVWDQALLDALIEYPIRSPRSRFSYRSDLARLGLTVTTALRFVTPDGAVRPFEYSGDPGLVRLDPRWHQAALHFVGLGFAHILDGIDHLLFLLCLIIPFRRVGPLVLIVTAFTVAHSITLIASAFGLAPGALWFPPLVETLIAMSIVYMALENIVLDWRGPLHPAKRLPSRGPQSPAPGGAPGIGVTRRWVITFAFGLVHGFGFSFALRETLQFAGSHLMTSLLAFNVGVELGQLLVLALFVPALNVLFRFVVAERMGTMLISALVAHTAWHWLVERGSTLGQYGWPALDAVFVLNAIRVILPAVIIAAVIWAALTFSGRRQSIGDQKNEGEVERT
jgi:hypothetical protein